MACSKKSDQFKNVRYPKGAGTHTVCTNCWKELSKHKKLEKATTGSGSGSAEEEATTKKKKKGKKGVAEEEEN